MFGTTKLCLRKLLGPSQVDEEEIHTILVGTEAALNSRRIIQVDDNDILTPSHFLTGGKLTTIPHGPEPNRMENLTKSFRQLLTEALCRGWQKEYLLHLRNYHEVRRPARQGSKFKVGDIVLLREKRMPRHMWKKARIDEILRGQIRTVSLRLPDRTKISHPVQFVIPLEIDQYGNDVKD